MTYCTQEDIETRIGPDDLVALADHDGDGTADTAVVEQAILGAEAVIDTHLGVRFAVPVLTAEGEPPDALRARAVNLAVYFLQLGRDSLTDDLRAQHEADLEWLREVATGRASLGIEPEPAESAGAPGVRTETDPRVFGREEPL
ncbi:MAG: DUF1320 domain-containing protein [Candidatus Brocadiia bacterium]